MPINVTSRSAALLRIGGAGSLSDSATTGLPEGVSLQEIDGGPTYYADNGFTYAAGMGWDNPDFFPIGVWNGPVNVPGDVDAGQWVDLSINVMMAIGPSFMDAGTFAQIASDGMSLFCESDDRASSAISNSFANWVGNVGVDEAITFATAFGNPVAATANAKGDARCWYWNGNWFFVMPLAFGGGVGGLSPYEPDVALETLTATPNATTRHLDIVSTDLYWMAGVRAIPPNCLSQGGDLYGLAGDMTVDQAGRACHYGDMVDRIREHQTTYPAPIVQFIENGGPFEASSTQATYIVPAEMNAAVWASIIHGCRFIIYFNHSFGGPAATPDISTDNFGHSNFHTIQSGETISIYDQASATNALVASLATVINSPTALGYVTVSPPGVVITASVADSGFDVMAKYHNVVGGDNKFYIFAMPRSSRTATSLSATFTIVNTGATQVTVINEARTISVTGGGTTFTDTFATGNTVHIYRVDD